MSRQRRNPPRCRVLTLEHGCPLPCGLAKRHTGVHEGRRDTRTIEAFRRDLEVLAHRDRNKSLQWIADHFGVSRERIRQREERILRRLAEAERAL